MAYDNEETWDAIAQSFDKTRRKPWPQCIEFIEKLPPGCSALDLGCGNGRHLLPCAEHCTEAIGIDISRVLLNIVSDKAREQSIDNISLFHADLTELPLTDNSVDAVLFIAALHNIPGRTHRVQALTEVRRVLKTNGIGLVSVWSRWQDRFRLHFFKEWFLRRKPEFGDTEVWWQQNGLRVPRFYHLYSKREFEQDLKSAGLTVDEIQSVKLASKKHADNYFATIHK